MMSTDLLVELMERFVRGEDRSVSLAGAIEVGLADLWGDQEPFAALSLALASYQPGGGEFLYDEQQIAVLMKRAIEEIAHKQR